MTAEASLKTGEPLVNCLAVAFNTINHVLIGYVTIYLSYVSYMNGFGKLFTWHMFLCTIGVSYDNHSELVQVMRTIVVAVSILHGRILPNAVQCQFLDSFVRQRSETALALGSAGRWICGDLCGSRPGDLHQGR